MVWSLLCVILVVSTKIADAILLKNVVKTSVCQAPFPPSLLKEKPLEEDLCVLFKTPFIFVTFILDQYTPNAFWSGYPPNNM